MDLKLPTFFSLFIIYINSYLTYENWQFKYNISYSSNVSEYIERKQTYDISVSFVTVNKLRYNFEYELGLNEFADLPFEYFEETYNGLILPEPANRGYNITYLSGRPPLLSPKVSVATKIPSFVDYRNYSLPILNQKLCNSCWAFSVVDSLASKLMMQNTAFKTLLSPQYLMDCDTSNYGCYGGWPTTAFKWILQKSGNSVPSLATYPYFGFKMKCRTAAKLAVNIKAVVQNFTNGNENMMKEIVANNGPVVVAFHVTSYFQLYSGGIFYDPTCNTRCLVANHAMVIVGYGTDSVTRKDYWIIKNSWGTSWGLFGYSYVARNRGNQCNLACWAMYTL